MAFILDYRTTYLQIKTTKKLLIIEKLAIKIVIYHT